MANLHGLLAQWLERLVYTQEAAGSNPARPTIFIDSKQGNKRLAVSISLE